MASLDWSLDSLPRGVSTLETATPATALINAPMVLIAPLKLVYPLLASPFLTPARVWHLLNFRNTALGCTKDVEPFFDWLRFYMWQPEWEIVGLTSVDLSDTMLQQRQALVEQLVPEPLLPPPTHPTLPAPGPSATKSHGIPPSPSATPANRYHGAVG